MVSSVNIEALLLYLHAHFVMSLKVAGGPLKRNGGEVCRFDSRFGSCCTPQQDPAVRAAELLNTAPPVASAELSHTAPACSAQG